MQPKNPFTPVDGERVRHILCNLACKQDGEQPRHRNARYSELESMVVEIQGVVDAMADHHGREAMGAIVKAYAEKQRAATPRLPAKLKEMLERLVREAGGKDYTLPEPNPGESRDDFLKRVTLGVHEAFGISNGNGKASEPTVKVNSHKTGETKDASFGIVDLAIDGAIPKPGTAEYETLRARVALQMSNAGVPPEAAVRLSSEVLQRAARK